ncbi:MAG TPA: Ig-like domain-containing protein [Longimicrobium sp.]
MAREKRWVAFALLIALGCSDLATPPDSSAPSFRAEILDARYGGRPHFYFLQPIATPPNTTGTFDSAVSPIVQICVWTTSCENVIGQYTMTSGPGAETVHVDIVNEQYFVDWRTDQYSLDPARNYRIKVLAGGTELGHADVDLVRTAKEVKNVNNSYVAVVYGRTLRIRFRIEAGIVNSVKVSPAVTQTTVGSTKQFFASVYDLHDELLSGEPIVWSSSDRTIASVDQDGLVTGLAPGIVTIFATVQGRADSVTFTVLGGVIAFASNRDSPAFDPSASEIYIMEADGNGLRRLTYSTVYSNVNSWNENLLPVWSPDGKRIAFIREHMSSAGGNPEIYVINSDGTGEIRLTFDSHVDSDPTWSPDGNKIAFVSNRSGNPDIYVVNSDGSGGLRDLTNDPAEDEEPTWSPTGPRWHS